VSTTVIVAAAIAWGFGLLTGVVIGIVLCTKALTRMHLAELERFGNMLSVGSPTIDEPEIVDAPPDAVARARAEIHKDRVSNGIAVLQQRYKDQGLTLTDEEARVQVEAMLVGNSPV
jgi:hypothetical protein